MRPVVAVPRAADDVAAGDSDATGGSVDGGRLAGVCCGATACSLYGFAPGFVGGAGLVMPAIGGSTAEPRDPTPYPTANPTNNPIESMATSGSMRDRCAGTTAAAG